MERIGKVACRLDLPSTFQIHNVFHIIFHFDLKHWVGEKSPELQPLKLAIDLKVWEDEVEAMFVSRIQKNQPNTPVLQYKLHRRDTLS